MQAKIIELLSRYLLIPLLTRGIMWIVNSIKSYYSYLQEKRLRKKQLKENIKKADEYESSSVNDAADSFNKLP